MEIIKRKILLEKSLDRSKSPNYGSLTANSFYIKVMLTQSIDDMGMFIDLPYVTNEVPDYNLLTNKLISNGIRFPFMDGISPSQPNLSDVYINNLRLDNVDIEDFYVSSGKVTGFTESQIEGLRTYKINDPYVVGFDINQVNYINYLGNNINGVSRITNIGSQLTAYTYDANLDSSIGTNQQNSGLLYSDSNQIRSVLDDSTGVESNIGVTTVQFIGEGWNATNTTLSANTKLEYLFGITSLPQVESDLFIDRGSTTVMEKHLRLSEIRTLSHLQSYGNGFYNINKQ